MGVKLQTQVRRLAAVSLLVLFSVTVAPAQTTSFTYQGRLTDGGTPATANYDLQFTLWDALSGGTQQAQPSPVTVTRTSVLVTGGIFSVQLDFGVSAFPGADRFLEIGVRPAGVGSFTTLTPRQPITSTPYAIRSLNASSADAVTVSGVPAGSGNYIQNATAQQASANFNISGNGTAGGTLSGNVVNAATQYNIGGNRVLSAVSNNLFAGGNAGAANTTGASNSFFGFFAGSKNMTGENNSFFGTGTGANTLGGSRNSFFGKFAGLGNTAGLDNSFFGSTAGQSNTGDNNSFFGSQAGFGNITGGSNTSIGAVSGLGSDNLTNATAIGALAEVDQSNALVLGSIAGVNFATTSVNVGIGTTRPTQKLAVETNSAGAQTLVTLNVPNTVGNNGALDFAVNNAQTIIPVAKVAAIYGAVNDIGLAFSTFNASGIAERVRIDKSGRVGVGTTSPGSTLEVKGQPSIAGFRVINSMGLTSFVVRDDLTVAIGQLSSSASSTHVCIDGTSTLSFCTSSLRYKQQVAPYRAGLDLIRRLHPISFTWKSNGTRDLGLGAEDVAEVEPLLVTHNNAGEIQGVKYDQLNVVLINAIKEQQTQIDGQREQISQQQLVINRQQEQRKQEQMQLNRQREQLDALKRLVCSSHPRARVCR
jgi:hypothetical protein